MAGNDVIFGAPCQLRLLAGPEHGRTIPLADIGVIAQALQGRTRGIAPRVIRQGGRRPHDPSIYGWSNDKEPMGVRNDPQS
jgi:hypothetical protein